MEEKNSVQDIRVSVLLIYGKIMLESNYSPAEIKTNLEKIKNFMNIAYYSFFITQTVLVLINTVNNDVKMISVNNNSYNFEKMGLAKVVVSDFFAKKIAVNDLYTKLTNISEHTYEFPFHIQIFCSGLICASMYCLINKTSFVALLAFGIGIIGYALYLLLQKKVNVNIFSVFLYSMSISLISVILFKRGIISDSFSLILSCLMPLLPGSTIVNAIKSGINGDYLSGLSQGFSAINTILMLGIPVAFIISNYG